MKVSIGEIWLAPGKYNIFWRSPIWKTVIFDNRIKPNFVKVKNTFFFLRIWNGAHRCLVNTVLSLLRHTQCEHDFRRFSIIRFIHKTPFEIINSFQNHTKKTIPKTHQTSVSVAPNALEPLYFLASPCSFGCSDAHLHLNTQKNVNIPLGIIDKSWNRKKSRFQLWRHL